MKDFDCHLCIHQNVCPAYDVTQEDCDDYLRADYIARLVRCRDCVYHEDDTCKIY